MDRKFYLELAAQGLSMPIGTDLILKEKDDHETRLLDGKLLGEVIVEAANRFKTPLAFPLMDLAVEKEWMLSIAGVPANEIETYHFNSCPGEALTEKIKSGLKGAPTQRIKANCDAIRHVAKEGRLLPVGMSIGPFSLMTKLVSDPITGVYLAGMGTSPEDDPEVNLIETALEISTTAILDSIRLQIEAGAKAICLCEPAANLVYLSPKQLEDGSDIFERYVMKYNKIIRNFLAETDTDLIFHDCGELTDGMLLDFNVLDSAIMSLGSSRTLWKDAELLSKNTVLFGNLPSKKFYSDKDVPESMVRSMSEELRKKMKEANHPFILGSECDVLSVPGARETILSKVNVIVETSS
ncbi:MAG: hypothetical protein A2020_11815 [Lentisphaerae bacterium GWF2_45_14]|nr:MAG: hypothetical protein A2020_11815 [Lentisphaerae bacterium GWF2_45_14]